MTRVTIRFNDREWKAAVRTLGSKMPAALKRSLKRSGTTGRAKLARDIRSDMGIKVGAIKAAIEMRVGASTVSLVASGVRIPLIDMGARGPEPSRGKGGGVRYRSGKGGTRISNAFIATIAGRRGVFKRATRARTPTVELFGPSIVSVFRRLAPGIVPDVRAALIKNLRHEVSRVVGRE